MILREFLASLRDVCLFRRGPEDMPYSQPLLIALLVACGVLQVAFNLHDGVQPALIAGAILGGLAMVWLVFLLLRGTGKPERFVQTATTLAAVYLLFGLAKNLLTLLLPVKAWQKQMMAEPAHLPVVTGHQAPVMFAIAALVVWQFCVWVGILRRALEIPVAGGVLVFLLLLFVNLIVAALTAGVIGVA
ncbi:MAG TPA: hypothetical protein VIM92_09100 [Rhodanobacteraceae bacterium]